MIGDIIYFITDSLVFIYQFQQQKIANSLFFICRANVESIARVTDYFLRVIPISNISNINSLGIDRYELYCVGFQAKGINWKFTWRTFSCFCVSHGIKPSSSLLRCSWPCPKVYCAITLMA